MNLTPMIDVVFLLLFFFLVASRFAGFEAMLPAQLPAQAAAVSIDIPQTPIRIRFQSDASTPDACLVTIEPFDEPGPMAISELTAALAAIIDPQAGHPGFDTRTPVHLLAGDDVRWEHVVNAYNAALAARYERVFFAGSR
jgi:biopolymer transport protein ExbD